MRPLGKQTATLSPSFLLLSGCLIPTVILNECHIHLNLCELWQVFLSLFAFHLAPHVSLHLRGDLRVPECCWMLYSTYVNYFVLPAFHLVPHISLHIWGDPRVPECVCCSCSLYLCADLLSLMCCCLPVSFSFVVELNCPSGMNKVVWIWICNKFQDSLSNSCWNILIWTTNVNLIVALEERWGDHQRY